MRKLVLFAATCSCLLLAFTPAHAFLSVIRQGSESADVPNSSDRFGATVCAGDFDGDGYDDLATAAPDESNGLINTAVHGLVTINYGGLRGLSHLGAVAIDIGDLGTEAARFGRSLCAADFDKDGYDDLAVGIPQLDNQGGPDRGAVYLYAGSANGLEQSPYRQILYDDIEASPQDYANFGWALTSGDFDDDGYPDLCTSAIGQDNDTGVLYFFFGSQNSGITTTGFQKLYPYTVGGSQALGGRFGWSLAAGQYNGTGGDDLAVGAPMTDVQGQLDAGRVYLYYAGASGISGTGGWFLDASNMGISATEGNAELGFSLASGHLYQVSGQHDLAMGAPGDDYGQQLGAGSVITVEFDNQPGSYDSLRKLRQLATWDATNPSPGDGFGYSVAIGKWDIGNYEDLAIGAPWEDVTEQFVLGEQSNAGIFHVIVGAAGGPSMANALTFDMTDINNFVDAGENLGYALCFGRFDSTGRESLAVGAPRADYDSYESGGSNINDAGQVHIVAPWRQPSGHPHRSSALLDCDGFLVYAQRPFQRVRPASTTKTVTLQLACDEIFDNGQDPQQFFTVPDWVADSVGGSQTPLVEGEQLSFVGLMQTMMTVSGNDSAMLLGAIMSGDGGPWEGWSGTSPAFATMMETKLNQMGLSGAVSMTNAAGIDSGDHYTTALDWALLAYLTIQDDCVKTIVNQSPWIVERIQPAGTSMDFFVMPGDPPNGDISIFEAFFAGWVDAVKSSYPAAVGIKPGLTPGGWGTGVTAADPFGTGQSAASSFGSRRSDVPVEGVVAGSSSKLNADLLALAETFCDDNEPDDSFVPPPPPDPKPWGTLTSIPPCPDEGVQAMTMNLSEEQALLPGRLVQLDLMRRTHFEPSIPVRLMVGGTEDINIGVGELSQHGIAPHQQNAGVDIKNVGDDTAAFDVLWNGSSLSFSLAPGDVASLPPVVADVGSFDWHIQSTGRLPSNLELHHKGYQFETSLRDGIAAPDYLSLQLVRSEQLLAQSLTVHVRGLSPTCGDDLLSLVARQDDNVPTGTGDDFLPPAPVDLQLLPNYPNPFNPATTVRFDLPRASVVDLAIYDIRGRLVRRLATTQPYEAGRHELRWDGTDDAGRSVTSGVYLLRMESGGEQHSMRMTLLK